MTRTNKITIKRTVGNMVTTVETECYEVGIGEMESALREVAKGKNEKIMREELIKNSRW